MSHDVHDLASPRLYIRKILEEGEEEEQGGRRKEEERRGFLSYKNFLFAKRPKEKSAWEISNGQKSLIGHAVMSSPIKGLFGTNELCSSVLFALEAFIRYFLIIRSPF